MSEYRYILVRFEDTRTMSVKKFKTIDDARQAMKADLKGVMVPDFCCEEDFEDQIVSGDYCGFYGWSAWLSSSHRGCIDWEIFDLEVVKGE